MVHGLSGYFLAHESVMKLRSLKGYFALRESSHFHYSSSWKKALKEIIKHALAFYKKLLATVNSLMLTFPLLLLFFLFTILKLFQELTFK